MAEYNCDFCGAPLFRSVVLAEVWLKCSSCERSYYFGPTDPEDDPELALQLIELYDFDVDVEDDDG